ncbi:unnamed protein product [Rangifer tarandus platyrhynchus]|uniref:Uncharacterized protein n=1 Tax=Rangifer tarandus platyrhynchus TaxID=3082113 RepID=A0AC59Z8U0_RANTA
MGGGARAARQPRPGSPRAPGPPEESRGSSGGAPGAAGTRRSHWAPLASAALGEATSEAELPRWLAEREQVIRMWNQTLALVLRMALCKSECLSLSLLTGLINPYLAELS